jgi:ribosomal protein S18 acetylase RimI-like enzyme
MNQPSSPPVPVVRRATADDAAALSKIAAATFVETFGHLYPPDDLQVYLTKTYALDNCRKQLADSAMGVWFATIDDEPAGFIVVGRCKLPVEILEPNAGEIQQLYVYSNYHNLRIGSRLMDVALDWLMATGREPLYVGVWSENYGAQRLYGRYGFEKYGEYGFPVGKTVDREFILKRKRS